MHRRGLPSALVERVWISLEFLERFEKSWSEVVIMVDWAVWQNGKGGVWCLEYLAGAMVVGISWGQGKALDWIGRGFVSGGDADS